jgi:hypothetical protein
MSASPMTDAWLESLRGKSDREVATATVERIVQLETNLATQTAALAAKGEEIARVTKEKDESVTIAGNYRELAYELVPSADGAQGALMRFRLLGKERDTLRQQLTAAEAEKAELREALNEHEDPKNKCKTCGYELTYCGQQDPETHVPAIDCPACDWMKKYQAATAQLKEAKRERDAALRVSSEMSFRDNDTTAERDSLRAQLADAEKARDEAVADTERLNHFGEWDVSFNHHCGGYQIFYREKLIGSGDIIRSAIDSAHSTPPAPTSPSL